MPKTKVPPNVPDFWFLTTHSEGAGGRAPFLAAERETRWAHHQPRRPHEEGQSAATEFLPELDKRVLSFYFY